MRRAAALAVAAIVGMTGGGCAHRAGDVTSLDEPGFAAPVLTLDGDPVTLRDELAGSHAIVDYWATWCGPCRGWEPSLRRAQHRYGALPGFEVVGVALEDDTDAIRRHAGANDMDWTHLRAPGGFGDPAVRGLGITSIPRVFGVFPGGAVAELRDGDDIAWIGADALGIPTSFVLGALGLNTGAQVLERYGPADEVAKPQVGSGSETWVYRRVDQRSGEEIVTTLGVSADGSVYHWHTRVAVHDPATVSLELSPAGRERLERAAEDEFRRAGEEPGTAHTRFLSVLTTDEFGVDEGATLGRMRPGESDWPARMTVSVRPGAAYRLRMTLVRDEFEGKAVYVGDPIDLGVEASGSRAEPGRFDPDLAR